VRAPNLSRFGRVAADVEEQSKKIDAAGNFIDNEMVFLTYGLVALAPVAVPSLRVPGLPVPYGTGRPQRIKSARQYFSARTGG
jgi:hypothetical protein